MFVIAKSIFIIVVSTPRKVSRRIRHNSRDDDKNWRRYLSLYKSTVNELTAFSSWSPQNGHRVRWIIG